MRIISKHSLLNIKTTTSDWLECEIIFKELCGFDSSSNKSITDFKAVIKSSELMCLDNGVRVMNSLTLTSLKPFGDGWPEDTPDWWKIYNRVKHGRSSNYKEANLENVLYFSKSIFIRGIFA